MTGRVKLTILIAFFAAVFAAAFIYMSSRDLYKDPSQRGTFVFERIDDTETWSFI